MKIILYIGHHKVGSTALQQFLAQNSFRLLQNGILYPAVESEGLSLMLSKAMAQQDFDLPIPINAREPHNALAYRLLAQKAGWEISPFHRNLPGLEQMTLILRNQINMLAPKTVVICSEVVSNLGTQNPELIDTFLNILQPSELELYCVLRRPDEYLVSWHGQRLRFGHKLAPLREGAARAYYDGLHFNYQKMLQPWIERTQGAKWHVRNYRDVMKAGGSTEDFMKEVSAAFPKGLLPVSHVNPSVPLAFNDVARRAAHALSKQHALHLLEFLISVSGRLDLIPNRDVDMFGPQNRAEITDRFEPIDAYLAKVIGQPAFFDDLQDMRAGRSVPEIQATKHALEQLLSIPLQEYGLPQEVSLFLKNLRLQ